MSEPQQRVLSYVVSYLEEHSFPPTVREIGQALGYAGTSTVQVHLDHLRELGYLEGSGRRLRRGWRISAGI